MARLITTETTAEARRRITRQAVGYELRDDARTLRGRGDTAGALEASREADRLLYPHGHPA